jgi:hypothetical protein
MIKLIILGIEPISIQARVYFIQSTNIEFMWTAQLMYLYTMIQLYINAI